MPNPFQLFSWDRPFLPALKRFIERDTNGQPGRALIIVPNDRPGRYLNELYSLEKKAGVLPKVLPLSRFVSMWSAASADVPYTLASPLDQIALLYESVKDLAETDPTLSAHFARMDMAQFLPWGQRLTQLFEDMFLEGVWPRDLAALEGDAAPLAVALLTSLGKISGLYQQKLDQAQPRLKTPGLERLAAATSSDKIPALLAPRSDRPVYIAGFSILSGAEQRLFRSLWQSGATICLHGDANLAIGGDVHDACLPLRDWQKSWGAGLSLFEPPSGNKPEYSFHAAYDAHSQLQKLGEDLDAGEKSESTAIVLPDPDLLLPALHHLRDRDLNISMGYPLERSQLMGLFNDIFDLQLSRAPDGRYYWRSLLRLARQPFLRFIRSPANSDIALHNAARVLDKLIRGSASKYIDLQALKNECAAALSKEETDLLFEAMFHMIEQPAAMKSCEDMGAGLDALCHFLAEAGGDGWASFPLDAEALVRLQGRALPALRESRLSGEEFPRPVLFGMLKALLEAERIPFEAEPLVAAQILGLMETRLLHFDNLRILDADDDALPGAPGQDPLLPDQLRAMAGLPDANRKRRIAAYNVFRLMQSAKNVAFYWAEGAAPAGSESGRRTRSRYVEELLWAQERERGELIEPGERHFTVAKAQARLNRRASEPVARGPAIDRKMNEFLAGKISPTALDEYLACPASFALNRLLKLESPEEVNERDDPLGAGECAHQALAKFLEPYKDKPVKLSALPFEELRASFAKRLVEMDLKEKLPVDSYIMLEKNGERLLRAYLEGQKEETIVREIEEDIAESLELGGFPYNFRGRIDRIDERDGAEIIIDYKTGHIKECAKNFWQDASFFNELAEYAGGDKAFDERAGELFLALGERLGSAQLPVYLLLRAKKTGAMPKEAAFVELAKSGDEKPLFGPACEDAKGKCEAALGFILWHMRNAPVLSASGKDCGFCEFQAVCAA